MGKLLEWWRYQRILARRHQSATADGRKLSREMYEELRQEALQEHMLREG